MALVRPEDRLDGASNFITWKERVMNIIEEFDLDIYVLVSWKNLLIMQGELCLRGIKIRLRGSSLIW